MNYIAQLWEFYKWTLNYADPRVAEWPLMDSPLPTICIVCLYLAIVLYFGPRKMKNREPFEFGNFLPAYNFALVALNYYIVHLVITGTYSAGYNFVCTPLTKELDNVNENKVALGVYLYYLSKIIELFDTMLFLMRKRYRQITFLHVYHHSTMPILWWIGAKWIPGGQSFFGVTLNSFVHVIMYSYYGLAALGPSVRKYLWWKKYITILQLVQFCLAILHTANSLRVDCPAPKWMHYGLITYAFTFIVLFSNFYRHAYNDTTTQENKKAGFDSVPLDAGDHRKRATTAVRRRKL